MARNTRHFSDIELNFIAHPITGDINIRYDDDAIKQSVKNLVLTHNYERPFHSDIGSPVHGLLFELSSPLLSISIKRIITDLIFNYEPRVNLTQVSVNISPENNSVNISIYFTILNTSTPITLDITLERTR